MTRFQESEPNVWIELSKRKKKTLNDALNETGTHKKQAEISRQRKQTHLYIE